MDASRILTNKIGKARSYLSIFIFSPEFLFFPNNGNIELCEILTNFYIFGKEEHFLSVHMRDEN